MLSRISVCSRWKLSFLDPTQVFPFCFAAPIDIDHSVATLR
jgi:hypothetical protein